MKHATLRGTIGPQHQEVPGESFHEAHVPPGTMLTEGLGHNGRENMAQKTRQWFCNDDERSQRFVNNSVSEIFPKP